MTDKCKKKELPIISIAPLKLKKRFFTYSCAKEKWLDVCEVRAFGFSIA